MRDQTWNSKGELLSDLEFVRESEGLICYDRISGVRRNATTEEVTRWNIIGKDNLTVVKVPKEVLMKPNVLRSILDRVRGLHAT